jgi:hypothetical protein
MRSCAESWVAAVSCQKSDVKGERGMKFFRLTFGVDRDALDIAKSLDASLLLADLSCASTELMCPSLQN